MRIISRSLAAVLFLLLLTFAALPIANAQETTAAVQGISHRPHRRRRPQRQNRRDQREPHHAAVTTTDSHGFYRLNALASRQIHHHRHRHAECRPRQPTSTSPLATSPI